ARGGKRPDAPGNSGMQHLPPHIQQQLQQQYQQEQWFCHQQRQEQERNQREYQRQVEQFRAWLKANGASAPGGAGRLPDTPQAFDIWARDQQQKKARSQPYNPMYDHYRSFALSGAFTRSVQSTGVPPAKARGWP